MYVQVYRNLHRGGYSVMSLEPGTYGKVIDHADKVIISNPRFVVQPAGRKRVIKEGRKNVHAFIRGELSDHNPCTCLFPITYNPYRCGSFVDSKGEPVYTGAVAVLDSTGAYYAKE